MAAWPRHRDEAGDGRCRPRSPRSGAAGCGDSSDERPGRSGRLVDFSKRPPFVNSLERDPESGEFLLTTNRGFFRIDPETDSVRRVRGTIEAEGKRATVGTFLELNLDPQGQLVGSGHPDQRTLPQYLGYLRSDDGGRTLARGLAARATPTCTRSSSSTTGSTPGTRC